VLTVLICTFFSPHRAELHPILLIPPLYLSISFPLLAVGCLLASALGAFTLIIEHANLKDVLEGEENGDD
jgi:hypothetical protein